MRKCHPWRSHMFSKSYRRTVSPLLASLALLLIMAGSRPALGDVVLDCNFNDKPVDVIIGTGGAAADEPVSIGELEAYVRSAPFSTHCLEISDNSDYGTRYARFQFLDDLGYSTGSVTLSATLYFQELENYFVYVREADGASNTYLSLLFQFTGNIRYSDIDSPGNTVIGTYAAGEEIELEIFYDLNGGFYDLSVGGELLLENESYVGVDDGLGSIYFGIDTDSDTDGTYFVDDILVVYDAVATEDTDLSRVKSLYR